LNPRGGV